MATLHYGSLIAFIAFRNLSENKHAFCDRSANWGLSAYVLKMGETV